MEFELLLAKKRSRLIGKAPAFTVQFAGAVMEPLPLYLPEAAEVPSITELVGLLPPKEPMSLKEP